MNQVFNRLRLFARRFQTRWGQHHLRPLSVSEIPEGLESGRAFFQALFRLTYDLSAGWYMLETAVGMSVPRATGHIIAAERLDKDVVHRSPLLPIQLSSNLICKRLLYLQHDSPLYFALNLPVDAFALTYFRLVRVTRGFARSRMLRKLHAMHPHYKTRYTGGLAPQQHRRNDGAPGFTRDLPTLWDDYCALFERTGEIASYTDWIDEFDTRTDHARAAMRAQVEQFSLRPLISIIMPVFNPNPDWLDEAIASVRRQIYSHWELCIADDASTDPQIRPRLERHIRIDPRIKLRFREHNGHISAASNSALSLAQGQWICFLDQDDVLPEHALYWMVDAIDRDQDLRLIYSDEDKIDENGIRASPYFKPDWNPDLFLSQNLISHLGFYYAELVHELGGLRSGFEGSQDYDLALRYIERIRPSQIHHIPRVLYHWRAHDNSTAQHPDRKPFAMIAGAAALNEHLARLHVKARAESVGYGYRVRYELPASLPLVSLIIPTRNAGKLLQRCVESILTRTTYPHFELLIIDNGSDDPDTLQYLTRLAGHALITVARDERPFNYSSLNNMGVNMVRGDIVALINNDVEVITPDWLTEMVSHALRPEVGTVGARLWYLDDTLQHGGIVLGVQGVAGHAHPFLPRDDHGYFGRASLIQCFSAVTGACLVVRRSLYQAVGGLNEVDLQVAGNDVDFCLRVREAGYRTIWTPYAELYHYESATRGLDDTPEKQARSANERTYIKRRWREVLRNDPAYSPNLSLDAGDFSLAWPPRIVEELPVCDRITDLREKQRPDSL